MNQRLKLVQPLGVSYNLKIESGNILDLEMTMKAKFNFLIGTEKLNEFSYFHTASRRS